MPFRVITIYQQVHTIVRLVRLVYPWGAFCEELPFETGVGPCKTIHISQGRLELSFIYLGQAPQLVLVARDATQGVRLVKKGNSLVVVARVCDGRVEKLIHSVIGTDHTSGRGSINNLSI